ncbi:1,4-alpha-glucan branching protein GlgB [Rhodobacteraceae bacterium 2376]|uniref:1,4-alpha-glucan branching enzyme GlgB n=1 Tax=Rhabdonatronobacter sediminivivens TaxID=2743469 RepID=A0A7Z0KYS5_9RHOB|nr:1,4-alpha-glucan branching protein GlgB [Rhabdonatronobacter sediminivivens]
MVSGIALRDPPFDLRPAQVLALTQARLGDPFALLGPHSGGVPGQLVVWVPGVDAVAAVGHDRWPLRQVAPGVWAGHIPPGAEYRLALQTGGTTETIDDPYRFGPVLGALDEHLFAEGTHKRLWHMLGARVMRHEGVDGTVFAVWAPDAQAVSVVGEFNFWDGRRHPMRPRGTSGVWELFLPGVGEGAVYKYQIRTADGALQPLKADPVGFGSEHPPANASVVRDIRGYGWKDDDWMAARADRQHRRAPMAIYEVHLASWRRRAGRAISWVEAANELVDYVHDMGFTHLELMPVSEHPFSGSWGYQPLGLYAPTIRHGPPHEFRDLIDAAHRRGLGVLLDWVPGHFPSDAHGLTRFDGTHLYEHADPREGYHPDWNTLIYNFGRREVANFLRSNALYWLEEYHIDGLRVDAVASMLYRDYSRKEGEWVPNVHGGRENLEAIAMLRSTNALIYGEVPGIVTVAEESTAFPGVSAPAHDGGLGFGFKWNMGWMNDTLRYMTEDPVNRKHHHHLLTFGIDYAFTENFILPISHDEVVHGKGSMLAKMPGDAWQKFANLRAYYGFMWGHPGKKLLFMGCEFGQRAEWNHDAELAWDEAAQPPNAGLQRLVRDLNTLYRTEPALHARDCEPEGFAWLDGGATDLSVLAFARHAPGAPQVAVISNFTPLPRRWRCPLPAAGRWREALNTDATDYGGSGGGNGGAVIADGGAAMGHPASALLELPPLATLFLIHDPGAR